MFKQLHQLFTSTGKPFILIGGHALAAYGVFRHTVDVDFMVKDDDSAVFVECLTANGWAIANQSDLAIRLQKKSGNILDFVRVDPSTLDTVRHAAGTVSISGCLFPVPSLRMLISMKVHALSNAPERFLKDGPDIIALLNENHQPFAYLEPICAKYGNPSLLEKLKFLYACK